VYILLTYISLVSLVQPQNNFYCESAREAAESDDGGATAAASGMMASIASQTNMAKSLAYMIVFGYVMLHIWVDTNAYKAQFMLVLGCLDSLLLYGHLWDRVPSLQVCWRLSWEDGLFFCVMGRWIVFLCHGKMDCFFVSWEDGLFFCVMGRWIVFFCVMGRWIVFFFLL